jgi:hypothetical protein
VGFEIVLLAGGRLFCMCEIYQFADALLRGYFASLFQPVHIAKRCTPCRMVHKTADIGFIVVGEEVLAVRIFEKEGA